MKNLKVFIARSARIFIPLFVIVAVILFVSRSTNTIQAATTIASDTFSRNQTNTWGNAETGGAYSYLGSINDFDVNGSVGTINIPAAGGTRKAMLSGVSTQDTQVTFRFSTNKLPNNNARLSAYAILRNNSNSEYRARVAVNQNSEVFINTSRVINGGSETAISSESKVSGLTLGTNSYLNLKAQAVGTNPTTIQIKVWLDGQAEPGSFQFITSDSSSQLQTSGSPGVQAYLQSSAANAPILLNFDDLSVSNLATGGAPTSAPTPTPNPGITPYPAINPFPYPSELIYESNISVNNLVSMTKDNSGQDIIDVANSLGINVIRMNLWNSSYNSTTHLSNITAAQWDAVFDKLDTYGMKAIIMTHNAAYNSDGEFNQYYIPFMQDLMITKGLATRNTIFTINLSNEPYLSTTNIQDMIQVRNMIKAANPNMLVNTGGWKSIDPTCPKQYLGTYCWGYPGDAWKVYELNDFYSIHRYGYDRPTNSGPNCKYKSIPPFPTPTTPYIYPNTQDHLGSYINEIKQNVELHYPGSNKPILVEEYGADNGIVCDSHGYYITEAQQADIYDKILDFVEQNKTSLNLLGAGNWQLYEYCPISTAQGWGIVSKYASVGSTSCGTSFRVNPAGNVIKAHAEVQNP